MKIFKAFQTGIRSVNDSKRYIFLAYFLNLTVVIILGLTLGDALQNSLGSSSASENMAKGFDGLWYNSFANQATGLASTFDPSVAGFGAILNGLDAFVTGTLFKNYITIVGAGLLYLLMWTFFSAGFISVYKKLEEQQSFFQQAARFFPRFVILAMLAGLLYFLLFFFVLDWLSLAVNALIRETIDERIHFAYTVIKYTIVWILIWILNLLFDYSKIITVQQDHKNALTAPLKAIRVVLANFGKTFGLYFIIGFCWIVLMLLYWLIAPGAGGSSLIIILAIFLLGQIYLLSRIWIRCLFYASQTALCSDICNK